MFILSVVVDLDDQLAFRYYFLPERFMVNKHDWPAEKKSQEKGIFDYHP